MRTARGPRPLAVTIFAALLLALALWNLASALLDLSAQEEALRSLGLGFDWNRDWTIVASSAWFTVELIPILAVWLWASRFARLFLTAMAGIKLVLVLADLPTLLTEPAMLAARLIAIASVALLYTPGATQWFGRRRDGLAISD